MAAAALYMNQPQALLALFMTVLFSCSVWSAEMDNGILGEPEVQCGADTVEMQFRSKQPFRGKVYVNGHYSNPECKVDYTSEFLNSSRPTGGIVIKHGQCDMERQRMLNPQGMQFSAVVVISFHPTFITKIDKAYNVKCMYRELVRTVTLGLEVSMMTTQTLSYSFPMPRCLYTIRRDQLDGAILQYARVGQQVVHRWECESEVFGILVHSCVVEDGQGEKIEVIDSKGCHVDDYVLGDPTYIEALNLAYREAHVVKFADRITVRFQCQMRLCMKADGGCLGITPPICSGASRGLSAQASNLLTNSSAPTVGFLEELNATAAAASTTTNLPSSEVVSNRLFGRHRRELLRPNSLAKLNEDSLPNLVDGDFTSQILYVLDSTENPENNNGGNSKSKSDLDSLLRRRSSSGEVIAEARQPNDVCMSTLVFSLLMASITLVFVAVSVLASVICCRKLCATKKAKSDSNCSDSHRGSSSCYSSVASIWH